MKVDTNRLRSIQAHLEKALAQVRAMYPSQRPPGPTPRGALQRDIFDTAIELLQSGPVPHGALIKEIVVARPHPGSGAKDRRWTEVKRVVDTLIREEFLFLHGNGLVYLKAASAFEAQIGKV